MPTSAFTKSLKISSVLILATVAPATQKANANDCSAGDPWFFCSCARLTAQQCALDYQACGGFFVEGCWETYFQCRQDSGIDQCE